MTSGNNPFAMSPNSLSMGGDARSPGAKMRDVAAAAGVSVATVSNFLNNPHLVAEKTRARVEQAVHELNFQPDQHARELRRRRRPDNQNSESSLEENQATCPPECSSGDSAVLGPDQQTSREDVSITPGERVTVQVGPDVFTGTVDEVMPDSSYFWIWTDNGMGRRLLEASAAVAIDLTGE